MKKVIKRVGAFLGVLLGALLVYGVGIEPRFILDERRERVRIPGLHPSWSGAVVAVVADFQVGMWFDNVGMVERAVQQMVEADPAVALLAGDFLYGTGDSSADEIDAVIEALQPLIKSDIPTFAVLGNHDYNVEAVDELRGALERHKIPVLQNEAVALPAASGRSGSPLYVVGIGAVRPGVADPEAALSEVPEGAARIVFMHNPKAFRAIPPHGAPLAVAGHTHCGQIAMPGLPNWSYVNLLLGEDVVADGFAPPDYGAAGNRLFVTCGIGFSIIPARINAPPQIAFFELVRG